jgi:two-component system, NarL family, response regulator NreC
MTLTPSAATPALAAPEQRTVRLLLVDGHCLFRQALRALLAAEENFTVVGEAGRAAEALELIAALNPDLVITDVHLPDDPDGRFIESVKSAFADVAILVLTAMRARGAAAVARKAGALGYVFKDQGRAELGYALREVTAGRWYCSDAPAALPRNARGDPASASGAKVAYLTERQRQVLRSVALGYSTREIAQMLGVSVKAVHKQRERLRIALQLNGTAALTRFAIREGLIQTSPASS